MANNPNLPPNKREALLRPRNWSAKLHDPDSSPAAAENDPSLRQLQQQSEEFNARVHQALADIPVPPTLRDQILARSKIVTVPFWRNPQNLALAASLAILATALLFLLRGRFGGASEDQTFGGFQARMVGFALRQYDMDIHTNQLTAVQSYLAAHGAPAEFTLPLSLAAAPVKGGKSLAWQGKPVGMVCFGAGQETLYMFVVDSPLPGTPANAGAPPDISSFKNLATATWVSGGKTFFIAGPIPGADLERLVRS